MEDRVPTAQDIARASLQLDKLKQCFIFDNWLHGPQPSTMKVQEHFWQGAINDFWDCVKQFDMQPQTTDDLADMAFAHNSAVYAYERALDFRRVMLEDLIRVQWRDHDLSARNYQDALKTHWRRRGVELFDPRAEERATFAPWPLTARKLEVDSTEQDAPALYDQLRKERRRTEASDFFVRVIKPHKKQREMVNLATKWLQKKA